MSSLGNPLDFPFLAASGSRRAKKGHRLLAEACPFQERLPGSRRAKKGHHLLGRSRKQPAQHYSRDQRQSLKIQRLSDLGHFPFPPPSKCGTAGKTKLTLFQYDHTTGYLVLLFNFVLFLHKLKYYMRLTN
jgi:hypothetical protein